MYEFNKESQNKNIYFLFEIFNSMSFIVSSLIDHNSFWGICIFFQCSYDVIMKRRTAATDSTDMRKNVPLLFLFNVHSVCEAS